MSYKFLISVLLCLFIGVVFYILFIVPQNRKKVDFDSEIGCEIKTLQDCIYHQPAYAPPVVDSRGNILKEGTSVGENFGWAPRRYRK